MVNIEHAQSMFMWDDVGGTSKGLHSAIAFVSTSPQPTNPPMHPGTLTLTHPSPHSPIHILARPTHMTSCVNRLCDSATGACLEGRLIF